MRQTIQLNDTNGCETPVANHKICAQLPESVCDGLPIRSALLNAKQLRERHLGQDDVLRKGRNQPPNEEPAPAHPAIVSHTQATVHQAEESCVLTQ